MKTRRHHDAYFPHRVAAAVALIALCGTASVSARQAHKWWRSGDIAAELQLTDSQADAIEAIYESTLPTLRSLLTTLRVEEGELSDLIADLSVEEWELALQIDQVEAARSALSKARTLMLFRMRQLLSEEQLLTLRTLQEEHTRRKRREERAPN